MTATDWENYIIRGTLEDGMIIANAGEPDKVQLMLDNANIKNPTAACIYAAESSPSEEKCKNQTIKQVSGILKRDPDAVL